MRATVLASVLMAIVLAGGVATARAADRPLQQLPADVVRWSTVWMAIPRQMASVGEEQGPLAAVTVGPAQGMAVMVESTGREVWQAMQQDPQPHRRREAAGAVIRYQF